MGCKNESLISSEINCESNFPLLQVAAARLSTSTNMLSTSTCLENFRPAERLTFILFEGTNLRDAKAQLKQINFIDLGLLAFD